jgi:hypothetical protein
MATQISPATKSTQKTTEGCVECAQTALSRQNMLHTLGP